MDHSQVVDGVRADHVTLEQTTIDEGNEDALCAFHDMEIGDDVPVAVIDESGTGAVLRHHHAETDDHSCDW